jgi:hypothetical protein
VAPVGEGEVDVHPYIQYEDKEKQRKNILDQLNKCVEWKGVMVSYYRSLLPGKGLAKGAQHSTSIHEHTKHAQIIHVQYIHVQYVPSHPLRIYEPRRSRPPSSQRRGRPRSSPALRDEAEEAEGRAMAFSCAMCGSGWTILDLLCLIAILFLSISLPSRPIVLRVFREIR